MEIQINQKLIAHCLFALVMLLSSCSPKENPRISAIREWVQREYGTTARIEISGEFDAIVPDTTAYRGGIIIDNTRKEGIFFYNNSDLGIHFMEGLEIPWEVKGSS